MHLASITAILLGLVASAAYAHPAALVSQLAVSKVRFLSDNHSLALNSVIPSSKPAERWKRSATRQPSLLSDSSQSFQSVAKSTAVLMEHLAVTKVEH